MKKLLFVVLSVVGTFLSCINKDKSEGIVSDESNSDTLILRKRIDAGDSVGSNAQEINNYERPTHAAHYSANLPHYHNGQYHNGNY
ncbi:MAG: hypothetical protein K6F78_05595 [Bacteroidaceae bacterium]|nr:hypothetical protein [Bacteroidaceae bacterium]